MKYLKKYESYNQERIDEGAKEWILSGLITLASMAGITQTKSTTTEFDKNKIKKAELVQQKIESGDSSVMDLFSKADIELNKKNLESLKDVNFKKDKVKMDVFETGNIGLVKRYLKRGYTLNKVEVLSSDTIVKKGQGVIITDTIELNYNSDVLFETAGFSLNREYKNDMKNILDSLVSSDIIITKVKIESSTDKEPIKIGNKKLAELRSNSVLEFLTDLDYNYDIEVVNLPDQGPDIYKTDMSSSDRTKARKKTSKFRYVKLIIEYEYLVDEYIEYPLLDQITKIRYEMVKSKLDKSKGIYKFKGKDKKNNPHIFIKDDKEKTISPVECPKFKGEIDFKDPYF